MSLFILQLDGELRKLFGRKRTYIGFGAFLFIEILILVLLQLPKVQRAFRQMIERSGYVFEQYFSGTTLAFEILRWTIFFLGALYLALVAGDVVSKEVEEGTMRMILCRPVARWRVLVLKYLACVIYTFALIFFIGVTALIAGLLRQGIGGLFVFAPVEGVFALFDFAEGIRRYLLALPLLSLSLVSISSLGFALSCFNMKPAAATIVTLSIFFVDVIFRNIPYFESLKQWFFTGHMATWLNVFQPRIPAAQMVEDYAYLLAANLTLVIVGVLHFQQRDFKS
jgi:ABC-2 type transport system permease protein